MPLNAAPFAAKKYLDIAGQRMAFIDEGEGDAIVFQHGNPTSSYLWRNVMPHCRGLGRLIACDLIGLRARQLSLRRAQPLSRRALVGAGPGRPGGAGAA